MYPPPAPVPATLFTRLPDSLRKPRRTAWGDINAAGAELDCFLEGPAFDRSGNLYVTDIPFGRIFRISPQGEWTQVAEYDGWPNGLKIHRDGRIFIADYKHGIMLLDPGSGAVTPLLVRAGPDRFKGVNDLFFAANGDLYFTDQGLTGLHDPSGRLFRMRADGHVTCLLDNVPSPNGLVMNRDETALYLAVTRGNCVWRVPFVRGGGVAKVGVYLQLSGGGGPDGLALDEQGRLAVAHVGMGSVWIFDRVGEPVYRVRSCMGAFTTNVAFGWPDRSTLYITESESGTILKAELDAPGKPMYSHA
jgi:gluconolactonase